MEPATGYAVMPGLLDPQIPLRAPYGFRQDGTPKGQGYFGLLDRPGGGVSSELSIGVDIGHGDQEIPTFVPGLDDQKIDFLLKHDDPQTASPMMWDNITRIAIEHARQRLRQGLSPFAD